MKIIFMGLLKRLKVIVFLSASICYFSFACRADTADDSLFRRDVNHWFNAWALVSQEVYRLPKQQPVAFVFFDEHAVYTTSSVTAPHGTPVPGPDFMGRKLKWKKDRLTDSITLPNHRRVAVNLMSFASPLEEGADQAFFIMPLVSFWRNAGVTSEELGLDNLITAVFLHEFTHTQQMQNFGRQITALDRAHDFGITFSDDIVQYLFEKDSIYVAAYQKELQLFYQALSESNPGKRKQLVLEGLTLMEERHRNFLMPKNTDLPKIDKFFLTMEGVGQYSQYAWLIHKKGAGLQEHSVIKGMRRGGRWWSQDEGMVLFFLLSKLSPPAKWAGNMFGNNMKNIISLIREELKKI